MEIQRLASLTRLHRLGHHQLAELAPHAAERVIPAGRRVLLDGPFAGELALVADGRGIVRCAGERLGQLEPGDALGALAPRRQPYATATVTATADLCLVVFSARAIERLDAIAPHTVAALVSACAIPPAACDDAPAGPPPAARLSLVHPAAA